MNRPSIAQNLCKTDHRPSIIVLKRWLEQRQAQSFYLVQVNDLFQHSDRVIKRLHEAGYLVCLTPEAPENIRWYQFKRDDQPA